MQRHIVWTLLAAASAGCTTPGPTPLWDTRFGDATRAAFAQQILHPEAARAARPVTGADGQTAAAAQDRYVKSFTEAPPAQSPFTIGVSGAK